MSVKKKLTFSITSHPRTYIRSHFYSSFYKKHKYLVATLPRFLTVNPLLQLYREKQIFKAPLLIS